MSFMMGYRDGRQSVMFAVIGSHSGLWFKSIVRIAGLKSPGRSLLMILEVNPSQAQVEEEIFSYFTTSPSKDGLIIFAAHRSFFSFALCLLKRI